MRNNNPRYYLDAKAKEFVIENYNFAKPFSNFLPGIAGLMGIPMWVFYVSRAQGIISFGTEDKDHSILEFLPANKAYQLCPTHGFRTFIKIRKKTGFLFYEPFQINYFNFPYPTKQKMFVSSYGLRLEEVNPKLGLKVNVEYFTIPNAPFAGLARRLLLTNLDKDEKDLEILDGLPQIIPYGTANLFLKKLSRTVEAWMRVENLEEKVPFYKLSVDPTDSPEIVFIEGGNFYLNFSFKNNKPQISKPIVDPEVIFGSVSGLCSPREFFIVKPFKLPSQQITSSKTPSAFGFLKIALGGYTEQSIYSIVGKVEDIQSLNSLLPQLTHPDYFEKKGNENKEIIERIQAKVFTASGLETFALYTQQTYLDNILRGGLPLTLETKDSDFIYYVYSRKHGDLERDYNKFFISPTYFSQGNGNYRDMCQNRRLDVWFNPDVKDATLLDFFNLIQADGFNPLVIKEDVFYPSNLRQEDLKDLVKQKDILKIWDFLTKPFKLGEFLMFLEKEKITFKTLREDFLRVILGRCLRDKEIQQGEGFWTDHWTYNLDILENYLAVYPENIKEILLREDFTFFDNTYCVRPRHERYVLKEGRPRQLHSVYSNHAKFEEIKRREVMPHLMRVNGEVYKTTLLNKILCLIVNKLASLDPFGCGIEMEADKPNWFDALNGLPGLFGSSICETLELRRWIKFLLHTLEVIELEEDYQITLPEELHQFLLNLGNLIKENLSLKSKNRDFIYWDKSNTLKEEYREKTRLGFSNKYGQISLAQIQAFLKLADKKLLQGINKVYRPDGLIYSYFINEVVKYEFIKPPYIRPLKFKQIKLPLFLEGLVHLLRTQEDIQTCKNIYQAVRKSNLFDKKLKMYKITESLESAPLGIGRCRIFTAGWLENESIWVHMEYKYLLELLKKGLYEEFYQDFFNCVIAFQDPKRYGRSILENSSFLVSSAFPDKKLWGCGFVARLSGSTVEFLNIWLIMNVGHKPFYLNKRGELNLRFSPILSKRLFTKTKDTYAFNFLKNTLVVYHNPKRKHTFGKHKAKITHIRLESVDKKIIQIKGEVIPHPLAGKVRDGEFSRIDIWLA